MRGQSAAQTALLQVAREYSGLHDILNMPIGQILFFYDGLKSELMARGK